MTAGLLAAWGAAVCYGVGSVLQAIAAQRTASNGLDPRLFLRLARQAPYLVGLGLDLGGFALNVVALRELPLFLVQSLIAASVGVTAVVAVGVLRVRLRAGEVAALAAMIVGSVLLAAGAQPGRARTLSSTGQWALLACVPVLAAVATVSARRTGRTASAALAALAGVAFGGAGIAARGLDVPHSLWRMVESPAAWSVVAYGVLAALLFATALQHGSVTIAAAVLAASETIVPSIVGLAFLGDATRPGAGVAAAILGFALTLTGAIGLAGYAQPLVARSAGSPVPRVRTGRAS